MARTYGLHNNATAGELSPRLARSDLDKFARGYRLMQNFYPIPQGAPTRRPGSKFFRAILDQTNPARLIPFISTSLQAFALEFSNNKIRVIDYNNNVVVTLNTTYSQSEIAAITYSQSADVMYLAHGNHKPAALSNSIAGWSLADLAFDDGPYQPENTGPITITPSATTGTVTLVASASLFYANMVGTSIRLKHNTSTTGVVQWGWAKVTAFTDATHVTATVNTNYPFYAASAAASYRLSEWDNTRGWPSVVSSHESRGIWASTLANPISGWATQSSGFSPSMLLYGPTKSDGTVTADMSITFILTGQDTNGIVWISDGPTISVGTSGAEWVIEPASATDAWSPTNSKTTLQTKRGSQPNTQGIRIETSVIFVQQKAKKLREFTFNFQKNANQSGDLMLLADHIAKPGIAEICYVQDPHSYIAARLNNGELRFMTYVGEEDVGGWSRHVVAGTYNGGNAVVESICKLPDYANGYDALWMIVKRTVNGATVRYIEVIQQPFYLDAQPDAWYLDCALRFTGSNLTVISGLNHLEGQTVGVYRDGVTAPTRVVTGGQITLDRPANEVLIGLKYSSKLITIPMDTAAVSQGAARVGGTALGKKQVILSARFHLFETGQGLKVGSKSAELYPIETRKLDSKVDTAPPLLSEWVTKQVGGVYANEAVLYFEVDDPVPVTLLEYTDAGNVAEK